MDLDQKLEGFDEYANEDVRALFNSFNTDEDRKWAWFVVQGLKSRFEQLDHQIRYDNNNQRLEILIGLSPPNRAIYFHLAKENDARGAVSLWKYPVEASAIGRALTQANISWWLNSRDQQDIAVINERLDKYQDIIKTNNISVNGRGLLPITQPKSILNDQVSSMFEEKTPISKIQNLNIILYGPPGTGKTYHTINKALKIVDPDFYKTHKGKDTRKVLKERFDKLCEENKIVMTTFHQSYAYEDFVEGLSAEAKDGHLVYGIKKGVFKTICENAEKSPDEKLVLIIDEINRGNVSNIFGELITLIEDSKRAGKDEALSVILPYSKHPFSVPSNLYIVGTMNTADRSLTQIDTALRRRFHFEEMMPKPELLDSIVIESIKVSELLRCLNARIEALYDREHTLGHAFFMELREKDKDNIQTLAKIFKNKIIPLLQEYFFDDWGKIQLILGEQVVKEKSQFSNFATSNTNNIVIPKAYKITDNILEEPTTYMAMYANCIEHIND